MEELRALGIKAEQQENDPRALAHIVSCDKEHNRPVVGGMYLQLELRLAFRHAEVP